MLVTQITQLNFPISKAYHNLCRKFHINCAIMGYFDRSSNQSYQQLKLIILLLGIFINLSCSPDPCDCAKSSFADNTFAINDDCSKELSKKEPKWTTEYNDCLKQELNKIPKLSGNNWLKNYSGSNDPMDTLNGKLVVVEFDIDQKDYQDLISRYDLYDGGKLTSERYFETIRMGPDGLGVDCKIKCWFSKAEFKNKWLGKNLHWVRVIGNAKEFYHSEESRSPFGIRMTTIFNTATFGNCEILEYR